MVDSFARALLGGVLIGAAAALVLLTQGRIAGISGILGGATARATPDRGWRIAFVVGMVLAGAVAHFVAPRAIGASPRGLLGVVIAGVLVGAGTYWGNGCTSGHGVCGMSRGARRSIAAVMTFMATGALTAWLVGAL